jgi:hypothetical protein
MRAYMRRGRHGDGEIRTRFHASAEEIRGDLRHLLRIAGHDDVHRRSVRPTAEAVGLTNSATAAARGAPPRVAPKN